MCPLRAGGPESGPNTFQACWVLHHIAPAVAGDPPAPLWELTALPSLDHLADFRGDERGKEQKRRAKLGSYTILMWTVYLTRVVACGLYITRNVLLIHFIRIYTSVRLNTFTESENWRESCPCSV